MKHYLAILFAFTANIVLAQTEKTAEAQPSLALRVFEVNNGVPAPTDSTIYSVSKKNTQQLCWLAFNMPFNAENVTVEVFKSPSSANFLRNRASIEANADKTLTTVTAQHVKAINNNQVISQCWRFDESDPLGQYSLSVRVNDIQFPPQTFTVVK